MFIDKNKRLLYKNNPADIFSGIKSGRTVSVVFLDSVSFFPEQYLEKNEQNLPEMFVTFSHIRNTLIKDLNDNFKNFIIDQNGSWTIITAERK